MSAEMKANWVHISNKQLENEILDFILASEIYNTW